MKNNAVGIIILIVAACLVFPVVAAFFLNMLQGALLVLCAVIIIGLIGVGVYFFNQDQRDSA